MERPKDPMAERADRDQFLKDLYKKLQGLFGADGTKKIPPKVPAGPGAGGNVVNGGQQQQFQNQNQQSQMQNQSGTGGAPIGFVGGGPGGGSMNHSSPAPGQTGGVPPGAGMRTPQMANSPAPPHLAGPGGPGVVPGSVVGPPMPPMFHAGA